MALIHQNHQGRLRPSRFRQEGALLDLLFAKREGLVGYVTAGGRL